jgi:hypothetical protein
VLEYISVSSNHQPAIIMRKTLNLVVAVFSATLCASSSEAQTSGQTTSGNYSNTYTAPAWGQHGTSQWGTQSGTIGAPQANQPAGNSGYPNATGRPFGSPSDTYNPLTSRGRRF